MRSLLAHPKSIVIRIARQSMLRRCNRFSETSFPGDLLGMSYVMRLSIVSLFVVFRPIELSKAAAHNQVTGHTRRFHHGYLHGITSRHPLIF